MKKPQKAFFSVLPTNSPAPSPSPHPPPSPHALSPRYHPSPSPFRNPSPRPKQDYRISIRTKNLSQQMTRSYQKKRRDVSELAKYQSYLQFINESKIEVSGSNEREKERTHRQVFVGRKINNGTSKTPGVDTSFQNEMQNRRSMLQRRRISPYAAKSPTSIVRRQKQKLKLDKSQRKNRKNLSYSYDKKAQQKKQQQTQQQLQKSLFDGVQFFRDLGKGAHAVVRSAIDWKNRRKIAVKVYRKDELSEQQLQSIKLEILILRSIKHPNIAALYDVIQTPKTVNLIMQYGGGNSLFQHIRSKPLGFFTQSQSRPLFHQILSAISYLHSRHIIHRDIKPQNILINKSQQIKIIDFGFSLMSSPNEKIDTYCGTITYMAPEIVSKIPHLGEYADCWSLGVLLYTMLQGAFPFRGVGEKELFERIREGEFEWVVDVSREAGRMVEGFLRIKPIDRMTAKEAMGMEWMRMVEKGVKGGK